MENCNQTGRNLLTQEDINVMPAIDVHSHVGPSHGTFMNDSIENGSEEYLLRTMALSNITVSINSGRYAIMPRGSGFSFKGNQLLFDTVCRLDKVYGWVTVNPLEPDTFPQAEEMLGHPKILGIKVHPAEHQYNLEEYGDILFSLAAGKNVPLLGHSGEQCCLPETYRFFADRYPAIPVIAAHLGSGYDGDPFHHIRAISGSRAGNLYTDTSSMKSMMSNLLELAVKEIGAERILFGTDSGNYFSPCQRIRVQYADISNEDKAKILQENAVGIFGSSILRSKGEEV